MTDDDKTVIIHGLPKFMLERLADELAKLGHADLKVRMPTEEESTLLGLHIVKETPCDCDACTMRREAEEQGRHPLVHPSLKVVGAEVRDLIRHRLFQDHKGTVFFFPQLFHPPHELNLYTIEVERQVQEDFRGIKPALDAAGLPRWIEADHRGGLAPLEHCPADIKDRSGRLARVSVVGGPDFEQRQRERNQRAQ